MIIQYASDLHLEFSANANYLSQYPLNPVGDFLVLAGDIGLLGLMDHIQHPFFDWCAHNFTQTYIIPGNHEYYECVDLADTLEGWELPLRDNVRYLNNQSIKVGDAEIFFSTLWSPVTPEQRSTVQGGLNDCYRIVYEERGFCAADYAKVHAICLDWLKKALAASDAKRKIVVSHHCPTFRFVDPRHPDSQINSAFCANLDAMIEGSDIDCWIFGHTHYNGGADQLIGNTRMLTNQLGYVKYNEHAAFRHDAAIKW